jgi:hypothetical protein
MKYKVPDLIKNDWLYTMERQAFKRGYQKGYRAGRNYRNAYEKGKLPTVKKYTIGQMGLEVHNPTKADCTPGNCPFALGGNESWGFSPEGW